MDSPRHPCLLTTPEELRRIRRLEHPLQRRMYEDTLAIEPYDRAPEAPYANPVMPGYPVCSMFEAVRYMLTGRDQFARRSCAHLEEYMADDGPTTSSFDYDALGPIYATVAFDCMHDYLARPENRAFREKLLRRLEASLEKVCADASGLRTNNNNHYTRRAMALAGAAWALRGELPHTDRYLELGLQTLRDLLNGGCPDGSDPYGGTWLSTHPLHPLFAAWFHSNNGVDLFSDSSYLRNLARFRWYAALGDEDESLTLSANSHAHRNLNDSSEFYILARRYRDPYAQWMAHRIREFSRDPERVDSVRPHYEFYECDPALALLTFDPDLEAVDPATHYPPSMCFRDSGWAVMRDDWRRTGPVFGLRCARPGGRHWHPDCEPDFWHSQPSANEVFLYLAGQYILNGPGPVVDKDTALCNTMTVNGRGQFEISEACRDLDPDSAVFREFISEGDYDLTIGDATRLYPEDLGVGRYERTALFIRPGLLVIRDECDLAQPSNLDFRFHSRGRWLRLPGDQPTYMVETRGSKALVNAFGEDLSAKTGPTFCHMGYSSYCDPIEHLDLGLEGRAGDNALTTVWSLLGHAAPVTAPSVSRSGDGVIVAGASGTDTVAFGGRESDECSAGELSARARVCAVGVSHGGGLRRLFLLDGTRSLLGGETVLEAQSPVRFASLRVLGDMLELVVDSPVAQTIKLRTSGSAEDSMKEIAVAAGRSEFSERLEDPSREPRYPLTADLELTAVNGSMVVRGADLSPGEEVLLVGPPRENREPSLEVVRIASVDGGVARLASGVVNDKERYSVEAGAYLSRNLVANGCNEESDDRYWLTWGGKVEKSMSDGMFHLETGDEEAFVFQAIYGLERGREYRVSCRYRLESGQAWLVYHDPRKPDSLPLESSDGDRIVSAYACFMFPERPGPWKGGHRNRPQFLVGFKLAPKSRMLVSWVSLRQR